MGLSKHVLAGNGAVYSSGSYLYKRTNNSLYVIQVTAKIIYVGLHNTLGRRQRIDASYLWLPADTKTHLNCGQLYLHQAFLKNSSIPVVSTSGHDLFSSRPLTTPPPSSSIFPSSNIVRWCTFCCADADATFVPPTLTLSLLLRSVIFARSL